jgi:hypothetical protein
MTLTDGISPDTAAILCLAYRNRRHKTSTVAGLIIQPHYR